MKKLLLVSLLIFSLFSSAQGVFAQQAEQDNSVSHQVEARKLDKEAKILADYFAQHNSPLESYAQDFIDAAKMYDLDWRLVASIAGVESTFGKFIPGGQYPNSTSYNAWGWGASTPDAAIYFASWKHGIYTVSKGLRENYLNKGLTNPYAINKVYAASPTWGSRVSFFMAELEKFASNYQNDTPDTSKIDSSTKIAADSGQLFSN